MSLLEGALTFRYKDFQLTKRDRTRQRSVLAQLKNEGLITKDPVREKLWIGIQTAIPIVKALVSDALDQGTNDSDPSKAVLMLTLG